MGCFKTEAHREASTRECILSSEGRGATLCQQARLLTPFRCLNMHLYPIPSSPFHVLFWRYRVFCLPRASILRTALEQTMCGILMP